MSAAVTARRLKKLASMSLDSGQHGSIKEGHCAMELVAWVANEPHTDRPACVCPVITSVVITWNDGLPDNAARDKWIKPLLPALLNTRHADDAVLLRRMNMVMDWHIRVRAPLFLRAAKLDAHADALAALPEIVDETTLRGASEIASAARSAAESAARSAAESAARSAARSAAWSAARSAAESAARSAAWSAARSAAESAAWSAARSAAESAARSAAESAAESAASRAVDESCRTLAETVRRMCEARP